MNELFARQEQDKRAELVRRGWSQAGGVGVNGRIFWRNPAHGALMLEDDAFLWLARVEAQEAEREGPS